MYPKVTTVPSVSFRYDYYLQNEAAFQISSVLVINTLSRKFRNQVRQTSSGSRSFAPFAPLLLLVTASVQYNSYVRAI